MRRCLPSWICCLLSAALPSASRCYAAYVNRIITVCLTSLGTILLVYPVHAETYAIINLGAPGGKSSKAYAVNNRGRVTGEIIRPTGETNAFLWRNGKMILLKGGGVKESSASGLNDNDDVVGSIMVTGGTRRACLWQNGRMLKVLGTLGGKSSIAIAINNKLQVVGVSDTSGGTAHAFYWDQAKMYDLGALGGKESRALSINQVGQVVGDAEPRLTSKNPHAFLWQQGKIRDLGTLGGLNNISYALDVNNQGHVVGFSEARGEKFASFIWKNNQVTPLNHPQDWDSVSARSINNRGQIVGDAVIKEESRAILWSSGKAVNLNDLIPANSGWVLHEARAINDRGQIVGYGIFQGKTRAFLFTPLSRQSKIRRKGTLARGGKRHVR